MHHKPEPPVKRDTLAIQAPVNKVDTSWLKTAQVIPTVHSLYVNLLQIGRLRSLMA